ncbi:MAG: hypothetical protein QXY45_02250 [Candidatus Aenigmatarchaeota archaeon]
MSRFFSCLCSLLIALILNFPPANGRPPINNANFTYTPENPTPEKVVLFNGWTNPSGVPYNCFFNINGEFYTPEYSNGYYLLESILKAGNNKVTFKCEDDYGGSAETTKDIRALYRYYLPFITKNYN